MHIFLPNIYMSISDLNRVLMHVNIFNKFSFSIKKMERKFVKMFADTIKIC